MYLKHTTFEPIFDESDNFHGSSTKIRPDCVHPDVVAAEEIESKLKVKLQAFGLKIDLTFDPDLEKVAKPFAYERDSSMDHHSYVQRTTVSKVELPIHPSTIFVQKDLEKNPMIGGNYTYHMQKDYKKVNSKPIDLQERLFSMSKSPFLNIDKNMDKKEIQKFLEKPPMIGRNYTDYMDKDYKELNLTPADFQKRQISMCKLPSFYIDGSMDKKDIQKAVQEGRADGIANTFYSKGFLLETLLKLCQETKPLSEDMDLEVLLRSMCDILDEKEIVVFLLKYQAVDILCRCIKNTEDPCLMELLLSIITKMSRFDITCQKITESRDVLSDIFDLLHSKNPAVLMQTMNFFVVFFIKEDLKIEKSPGWRNIKNLHNTSKQFGWILSNCLNEDLLRNALNALDALLQNISTSDKNIVKEFFIDKDLLQGTVDAFKKIFKIEDGEDLFGGDGVSHKIAEMLTDDEMKKTIAKFLNTHVILMEYGEDLTLAAYKTVQTSLLTCLKALLKYLSVENYLLPIMRFTYKVFFVTDDILAHLNYPFDETIIISVIKTYEIVKAAALRDDQQCDQSEDFFEEVFSERRHSVTCQDYVQSTMNMLGGCMINYSGEQLKGFFALFEDETLQQLINDMKADKADRYAQALKSAKSELGDIYFSQN